MYKVINIKLRTDIYIARNTLDINVYFRTNNSKLISDIMSKFDDKTHGEMFESSFRERVVLKDGGMPATNICIVSIENIIFPKFVSSLHEDLFDIRHTKGRVLDYFLNKSFKEGFVKANNIYI